MLTIKNSVADEIKKYNSCCKFRLFGHHHGARGAIVESEICSATNDDYIRQILQNQYDLFFKPTQEAAETKLLDQRYSLSENLQNKSQGGYSSAINSAVDKYNGLQSDPTKRIAK